MVQGASAQHYTFCPDDGQRVYTDQCEQEQATGYEGCIRADEERSYFSDSRFLPNSSTTKVLDDLHNYHHTIDTCLDCIVNKDITIERWNSIQSEHTGPRRMR